MDQQQDQDLKVDLAKAKEARIAEMLASDRAQQVTSDKVMEPVKEEEQKLEEASPAVKQEQAQPPVEEKEEKEE